MNRTTAPFSSRLRSAAHSATLVLIEPVERRVLMSAGSLDPTFGTAGVVTGYAGQIATDGANRTLVAGLTSDKSGFHGTLTRLLANGSLDTSFGTNGTVAISGAASQIIVEPSGKILLVDGNAPMPGGVLQQLTAAGQPDTTFGTNGFATSTVGSNPGFISSASLGPNGTIYASDCLNQVVDRYTANGQLDKTFGTNGQAAISAAIPKGQVVDVNYGVNFGVTTDGAGRPVVQFNLNTNATDTEQLGLVRFTTTGTPDTTFGTNGLAAGPFEPTANLDALAPAPAVAPNGTIYAADTITGGGDTVGHPVLYAFSSDGKTMAGGAIVTDANGANIRNLAVDTNGRPVLTLTSTGNNIDQTSIVARFNAGSASAAPTLDATFGTAGEVTLPVVGVDFSQMSINAAGQIEVIGQSKIARLNTTDSSPSTLVVATGTVIGSAGSYRGLGNTIANAFDGNLSTYVDAANASGDWAGLDLGTAAKPILQIKFAPRAGWASRMVGGQFQVSSTANFSSDVHTLYTVNAAPVSGQLTTVSAASGGAYRYARYIGPTNGQGNVAEVQFLVAATPVKLTGTVIGSTGSYRNLGNTIANAFDGNLNTYVDGASSDGTWEGLDLGTAKAVTQVRFAPRYSWAGRMVGGVIQASTTADFSTGVVTAYTITSAPAYGTLTTVALPSVGAYRYWRYLSPTGSFGSIAELEFDG